MLCMLNVIKSNDVNRFNLGIKGCAKMCLLRKIRITTLKQKNFTFLDYLYHNITI